MKPMTSRRALYEVTSTAHEERTGEIRLPVTTPSRVVTATTEAPVRMSAPAARAADASASDRADGPPRANTVSPAAPPSLPAAC